MKSPETLPGSHIGIQAIQTLPSWPLPVQSLRCVDHSSVVDKLKNYTQFEQFIFQVYIPLLPLLFSNLSSFPLP